MKVGNYEVSLFEIANPDEAEPSIDCYVDFSKDDYDSSLLLEIGNDLTTRKVCFRVSCYAPREQIALPIGDERLLLMLDTTLCVFNLDTAIVEKTKDIDSMGSMIAAYPYMDGFILHGEMTIYRVDSDLDIQWEFSGRDIFVRQDSDIPAFQMQEDRICLYDFWDNYYEIDYAGKLICDKQREINSAK